MGKLVDGVWTTEESVPASKSGEFVRPDTAFRNKVTADGSSGFPAVAGRYHLYVSYACPWAHRTIILRSLKGLQDAIPLTSVQPIMGDLGWSFSEYPGAGLEPLYGYEYLQNLYVKADPHFTGRVSVPIFWDKEQETIVSNESSEIIVFLNDAFPGPDFYPSALRSEIDEINDYIYERINNGVYKCGFAKTQEAYDSAFDRLFESLDVIEDRLSTRRYLVGSSLTLADIRLFTTLIRFDPVYYNLFKTNLRYIDSYPNLSGYLRDVYQYPGIAETVNFDHIKTHYFNLGFINPTKVVPKGPERDYTSPHGREHLS